MGFITVVVVAAVAFLLFDAIFSNPIISIIVDVLFVLGICAFLGIVLYGWKNRKKWEEEERLKAEQREAAARRVSFYRCPYCGEDYSDILNWHDPFGENELQRCSRTCMRHFYFSESQAPRTPEHRALLEAEARDAARVTSSEFESVIEKIYNAYREIWKTDRHGIGSHIVMERDHAHYQTYKWVWNSETRYEDSVTTKHVPARYPSLETDAGRQALAMACMEYARKHSPYPDFVMFDLGNYFFSWKGSPEYLKYK